MAITLLNKPQSISPVFNPNVYKIKEVASPYIPGYRFEFGLFNSGDTSPFVTFKLAPTSDGTAIIDISKVLSTKIKNPLMLKINETNPICLDGLDSNFTYDVKVKKEYFINKSFTDYEYVSSGPFFEKTKLVMSAAIPYSAGDLITVKINSSITDSRKNLNGTFQVLEVSSGYVIIDLMFDVVGSGPTTPGSTWYFDQRKYTYGWDEGDVLEIDGQMVYNEAVSFKDFPSWTPDNILSVPEGDTPTGSILTNAPNYLENSNWEDRFIIEPHQKLFWNFFDGDANNVNSIVAVNDLGQSWIQHGCGSSVMKQFDVSPTADWISISPSWPMNPGLEANFLRVWNNGIYADPDLVKWYDIYTVGSPGFNNCDKVNVTFTKTIAGVVTTNSYSAYATGSGYGGKRLYEFTDVNGIEYWVKYYTAGVWGIFTKQMYNVIPTMTSDSLPYGTASASSNNTNAWKAFDGNPTTYWKSTTGFENAILTYELPYVGTSQSYATVKGYKIKSNASAWTIQIKGYMGAWSTVDTVTGNTSTDVVTRYFGTWAGCSGIRVYPNSLITGTEFQCEILELTETDLVAHLVTSSNCPSGTAWGNDKYYYPYPVVDPFTPTNYRWTTTSASFTGDSVLKVQRIYLDQGCKINKIQVLFLDRSGSWSSFAFPLRSIEKGNNSKLTYRSQIDFYGQNDIYNTFDSEITTYSSTVEKAFTITTDWLTTGMSDYFEELITSPECYIQLEENGQWFACTVTDTDFVNQKQKNKKLINRTITVKLSSNNPINI